MLRLHLFFSFFLLSFFSFSQEEKHSYLIVPNEPKLYISSADRDIAQRTGASYVQIRETFRRTLVKELEQEFSKIGTAKILLADSGEVYADLKYTYYNIGYKYEVVPAEETMVKDFEKTKKFIEKVLPKKEEEVAEVKDEEVEHFMNTSIHNPNLLSYLNEKYGATRFVFINQLDIKDEPKSAYDYGTEDLDRVVRVHFTILDINGNVISAGLAKKEFPAKYSTTQLIVNYTFPSIVKFISKKVVLFDAPEAPKPEEVEKKSEDNSGKM